jgi:hypothetical protein
MSEGPQYTSCVEPADFEYLSTAVLATLGILVAAGGIAALLSGGIGALIAIPALVQLLRYVLNFMVHGKLICLRRAPSGDCRCSHDGGTVCAIGEVADTENVGEDKNEIQDIDNDYSLNLVLAPFNMSEFAFSNKIKGLSPAGEVRDLDQHEVNHLKVVTENLFQGDLISCQKDMPTPKGEDDAKFPNFHGYFSTMVMDTNNKQYTSWKEIVGRDYGSVLDTTPNENEIWTDYLIKNGGQVKKFKVPVLHCEFEGAAAADMLAVIEAFSFGGKWCKKNPLFGFFCVVLQTIMSPVILAAVMAAWATAKDGSTDDAIQGGGTITNKDRVIVRGRWVFDGAHGGYNEIHATRAVQKIYNVPNDNIGFGKFHKDWCDRMSEIPRVVSPGVTLQSPEAQKTQENQQEPENQWTLHPELDGCVPTAEPPIIR